MRRRYSIITTSTAPAVSISSVTITGGEKETAQPGYGGGHYNVPKRDLIASVQLALEKRELRIARNLRERETVEELVDVRRTHRESGWGRSGQGSTTTW